MKKELLLAAAVLAAALPAFADNNSNNGAGNVINDNSGIGNGNISTNSNNPSLTANGGNSSATGGNASSKSNANSTSNASANSRNTNLNSNSARQGQKQTQKATSSVRSSGNSSNSYSSPQNPVSTAFAAPLTASDDTCMGSSSAGGQGVGFGLSLGTTWHDKDCVRRKDARELYNMGQHKAAVALLCQSQSIAEAMEAAGTHCPGIESGVANDNVQMSHTHQAQNDAGDETIYEYPKGVRKGW